jgi:hypothetical protein
VTGRDVTAEELAYAEDFYRRVRPADSNANAAKFTIERDQLIRLLAWYGAIRAARKPPGKLVEIEDKPTG